MVIKGKITGIKYKLVLSKVKTSYSKLEKVTGVKLHYPNGLESFKNKINKNVSLFMTF